MFKLNFLVFGAMMMGGLMNATEVMAQQPTQSPVPELTCLQGYPDGTFRGDRPITRYEFVAGLNACLQPIERLIESRNAEAVSREEITSLIQRLENQRQQLESLQERVGGLERRL